MNELTIVNDKLPTMDEMQMIMKYCEIVAQAPSYASMGGMPGIFALIMTARELGIGPMTALNGGMYLIPAKEDKDGKPKGAPNIMMAARTMNSMILRAGHDIEEIENTPEKITLKGTRSSGRSLTVTMTLDMARKAQLSHDAYGKPKYFSAWFKTPDDMLWKTCISKLGRRLFADVIGNCYEPADFEEKEAKEQKESLPKPKQVKGKNIVEQIEIASNVEPEQAQAIEQKETFEEFVELFKLRDQSQEMHKFIVEIAGTRGWDFERMLDFCYQSREGFLKAFNIHKNTPKSLS